MNKFWFSLGIVLLTTSCMNNLTPEKNLAETEDALVRKEALKEINLYMDKMYALHAKIDSVQTAMIEADESGNEELYDELANLEDSLIELDYSLDGYWSEKYGEIGEQLLDSLYYN